MELLASLWEETKQVSALLDVFQGTRRQQLMLRKTDALLCAAVMAKLHKQ